MSKFYLTCECGRPKERGLYGCDRCRTMEAHSAFESKPRAGTRQRHISLSMVNAACERALVKRGLGTIQFGKLR